jgi:hypothetical protein
MSGFGQIGGGEESVTLTVTPTASATINYSGNYTYTINPFMGDAPNSHPRMGSVALWVTGFLGWLLI